LLCTLSVAPATGADVPREPPPAAVHLVGHEDAALLQRAQDVIDDWDPRKLQNPYVEAVVPAAPSQRRWGKKALRRKDLNEFIADVEAAEALGKAFFWEMQAGSDFRRENGRYVGTACASCHYRFGADARNGHTTRIPYVAWDRYYLDPARPLEFGERPQPYPVKAKATEVVTKAGDLYLPVKPAHPLARRQRSVEEDEGPSDDGDDRPRTPLSLIVGSQGVKPLVFRRLTYGNKPTSGGGDWYSELGDRRPVRPFTHYKPEWSMFVADQSDDAPVFRQITTRNSPSVINAGFADRLFHDGRAESTFNGFSIFGDFDKREVIHVRRRRDGRLVPARVAVSQAALASQAVGPVVNDVEMSYLGRTFPDLAAKLLDAPVLGYQDVACDDSHLGRFKAEGLVGPNTTYRNLIRRAFRPEWWDGVLDGKEQFVPLGLAPAPPGGAPRTGPLMEANFSLYWGLSVMLYEASLVSNESPFDRMMRGDGKGVDDLWDARRAELEGVYIDRVRTTTPPPSGAPQFAFRSGSEVFQRGFRVFMNRGCIECHSGPLMSELYSRTGALEPKPPIASTLERVLLPNSQGDAIAVKVRERHDRVFDGVVTELARAHPEKAAGARDCARELELLLGSARGERVRLEALLKDRLARAGFPGADFGKIAREWLAFEKTAARFAGGRHFFGEDERVAAAERLADPVLVEKMAIPPAQADRRRPLPTQGPHARGAYAFYDRSFYALGVAPPRYDRGNGDWSDAGPADHDGGAEEAQAAAAAAVVETIREGRDEPSARLRDKLKGEFDVTRAEDRARLGALIRRGQLDALKSLSPAEKEAVVRDVAKALADERAASPGRGKGPTQAASGAPGAAYRFDPRWKRRPRRPDEAAPSAAVSPAAGESAKHQPGFVVEGPKGDPDAGAHGENPRDVSWFRDLPNWDAFFPPDPRLDSVDARRSEVHFFSRARALVQDETPWGHRKPLLHDNELAFWGAFKTPTLRNVELTPPYMHNGRLLTLLDVVDFYDRGGDLPADRDANPDKHPAVVQLDLDEHDKFALVFFLMSLTDDRVRRERAPFDHPSLRVVNGYDKDLKERTFDLEHVGAGGLPDGVRRRPFPSPR